MSALTAPLSLLVGKGILCIYFFVPACPFFLYLTPLQMCPFGWKGNGAMGQPSVLCPGHLIHATTVWPVLSHCLSVAFIISFATFCQTKYSGTQSHAKFGSVVTMASTWRLVFTPKWHCWQVPCHLLRSPSHRKVSLSCPWASVPFGEMRHLLSTTWLWFRCGVQPGFKPTALSANRKLSVRHFAWSLQQVCS